MMRRFKMWEARGKQCVLLYCGDHDPGGLQISDFLRCNIAGLAIAVGWTPDSLIIARFGLDYDFIEANNLTWIDNLETSSKHPDYSKPYVQNYLSASAHGRSRQTPWSRAPEPDANSSGKQSCATSRHRQSATTAASST